MNDLLRKYKSLYSSTCNTFSTGEGVTITPASVTGLPTDTEITLTFDRVDSSGTKTPSKMERIRGTITGSNFVISSGGRAVEGTEQVHTSPVVEMIWNADDWNDTVDHILTEHNQDGTHKDTLVTSLKATGAVVNTGTSDDTIVTPKAIADSKVSITDKVETLTNKTLTSPKINEDVALTATATQLNAVGAGGVTTRLSSKIIEITRDLAADSGDVSYTGVGFLPSAIIVFGGTGAAGFNIGMADSAKTNRVLTKYADSTNYVNAAGSIGSNLIFYSVTSGNRQTAIVKSWDADGFTLTWTKTGSPTGTITLEVLCFR